MKKKTSRLAWCVAVFVAAAAAFAQDEAAAPADYRVGNGDVLDVTVLDNPEASRVAPISPGGTITLPLVGDVAVGGLTAAEIRQKLTELLSRDYLVNPQVEVRIKEYGSQFALAVGEMKSPGRKALRGNTRLIDLLMDSGGFTNQASGDVVVTRVDGTFPDGSKSIKVRVAATSPTPKNQAALEFPLRNGDIVVASPKAYVIVEGEVNRPGRFVIEGNLTITGAVSIAGGLTRYGSNNVKLRRVDADGRTQILPVDLKSIRKGKTVDTLLQGDDVITVPRRLF
jgi:polysaccharide export outer membrane protein